MEGVAFPAGERLETFSTITTNPNQLLSSIHDRMPVSRKLALWLGEIEGDPTKLLRPAAEAVLRFLANQKEGRHFPKRWARTH
jgi:putative SOS response-associated peptidase YedK